MYKKKIECKICGRLFKPQHGRQKYCSDECKRKADAQRKQRERKAKTGSKSQSRCRQCGKLFTPSNKRQLYCTVECERKANKIRIVKDRDLDKLKEDVQKTREKQNKHIYGPNIDAAGKHGVCLFDEESFRGTNEGLGTIRDIPSPPVDASEEEWTEYKRLSREIRRAKRKSKK
jgi:hypothetical protein